jgi:hypothetical protein
LHRGRYFKLKIVKKGGRLQDKHQKDQNNEALRYKTPENVIKQTKFIYKLTKFLTMYLYRIFVKKDKSFMLQIKPGILMPPLLALNLCVGATCAQQFMVTGATSDESEELLADGYSATAFYGSEAANGAIVISKKANASAELKSINSRNFSCPTKDGALYQGVIKNGTINC